MILSLTYSTRLVLAVVGYLSAYVVGNGVAWRLRTPRRGRVGQALDSVRLWGNKLWLVELLRSTYYLIPPYVVLRFGWASPSDLGLANPNWISGLGLAAAFGVVSLVFLALLWWQYVQLVPGGLQTQQTMWLDLPWRWAFALREAILLESWWALVRSPMLMLAGPYFGVYLGLAALFVTGLLSPRTRYELATPRLRESIVLTASLAVVTATLYVFTHNLWLCITLHFVLRMAILQLLRHNRTREALGGEETPA